VAFACSPPTTQTPTPCADMFAEYADATTLVASADYTACVSVANANCLGNTQQSWCAMGGTSLAGSNVDLFLQNLQSQCNFPYYAVQGTFVFSESVLTGGVSWADLATALLGDLASLTSTTPSQGLFQAAGVNDTDGSPTVLVNIFSGVTGKTPTSVVNYLNAAFSDPASALYNGNVTKYLVAISFSDNFPFTSPSSQLLTDGEKAGIIVGVLGFVVIVLIIYQIYASKTKHASVEESDSEEDEEDDAAIHQRNQQRYAEANKQETGATGTAVTAQPAAAQPVQSQDEAIMAWS